MVSNIFKDKIEQQWLLERCMRHMSCALVYLLVALCTPRTVNYSLKKHASLFSVESN